MDKIHCTKLQCLQSDLCILSGLGTEHHHMLLQPQPVDLLQDTDPVQLRHDNIKNNRIICIFLHQTDCLQSVCSHILHTELFIQIYYITYYSSHECRVIYNQYFFLIIHFFSACSFVLLQKYNE